MNDALLSYYTPSLMKHDDLEAIFVGRQPMVNDVVDAVRASVLTESKHHTLFVGPRGSGKTHLVSMIYHRVMRAKELDGRMLIAWLREEEWGVTSFLDLLLRIFRSLLQDYPDNAFSERIDALYTMSPSRAEEEAAAMLVEFANGRTLLILMENLDDLFKGLADQGQRRIRSFLQEHPICTIVATSQSLFTGVSKQRSPFYGFFNVHHLEEFSVDDACLLLTNIARLKGDSELASFIQTSTGRARIRTVHHLAGGNPRIYIIFSHFMTRASLDELMFPFMRTLDDLTPYYQSRMAWLSQQQRKIVEFLCDRRGAVTVKEIAQRCFITHQTASSQLKSLREMSYVTSQSIGRDSYYELHEPLMRLSIEMKKNRGKPIQLFVDFLRLWYTRNELRNWLRMLQSERPELVIERTYIREALAAFNEEPGDPRLEVCWKEHMAALGVKDYDTAVRAARDLISMRGSHVDWHGLAYALYMSRRLDEALTASDKAIALNGNCESAWELHGLVQLDLNHPENAITTFDKAIQLFPMGSSAWVGRGIALYQIKSFDKALDSVSHALEIDSHNVDGWMLKAAVHRMQNEFHEAESAAMTAIGIKPQEASLHCWRGDVLMHLSDWKQALSEFDTSLTCDARHDNALIGRSAALFGLNRWTEGFDQLDQAFAVAHERIRSNEVSTSHLIRIVLRLCTERSMLASHMATLAALYKKHDILPSFSMYVTSQVIQQSMSETQQVTLHQCKEIWQRLAGTYSEFEIPLILIETSARYLDRHDRRILLELPVEQRILVEEILGIEKEDAAS